MASREDVLIELGLTPTWRRRELAGEAGRLSAVTLAHSPPPVAGREDADVRQTRIAALTWQEFASDVDACVACGLCKSRNRSVAGVGDL
ncbi:MAG: uracil-DNA glycosylase, partial [Betaproteobacteria bacterium]|nr:uracil-DNA glycosylase [Betaproteobacteria bacterium]